MDEYVSRIQYEALNLQNKINNFKQRIENVRNNITITKDERLQVIANIELVIHRQTMLMISYERQIRDMKNQLRQRNKRKRSADDNYSKRQKTLQLLHKLKF
ncbi:MAG: hypothetical protein CL881_03780 [Dehalococcoidia bacterium]|nr:hypothetical protein [Dehalococcoidia bacterium]